MAVFRGTYHLDRAVEACLAIKSQIEKLPAEPNTINFSPKVSIGINSGEMISGNIGSASLRRFDYTVVGDAVNISQRLQTAAKSGQILITELSFQKIKESFNCEKIGEISVKNKAHELMVYEVLN
jgi:class 3 adenylate cyclase